MKVTIRQNTGLIGKAVNEDEALSSKITQNTGLIGKAAETTDNVKVRQYGFVGATGPQGAVGESLEWRGAFDGGTTYELNDAVSYLGSSYVCISPNPISGILPDNPTYWDLMAAAGTSGPGGDNPENTSVNMIAGENISPFRVVYIQTASGKVFHADNANMSERDKIIGINSAATAINDLASIYITGTVTNPAWTFDPGPVYVGSSGVMTQIEPTNGYVVKMGIALSSTKVLIDVDKVGYVEFEYDNLDGGTF